MDLTSLVNLGLVTKIIIVLIIFKFGGGGGGGVHLRD